MNELNIVAIDFNFMLELVLSYESTILSESNQISANIQKNS
jgi:hypothetical protein